MEALANAPVIIVSQYINISNQHVVHLKAANGLCQLDLENKVSAFRFKLGKKRI